MPLPGKKWKGNSEKEGGTGDYHNTQRRDSPSGSIRNDPTGTGRPFDCGKKRI